MGTANATVLSVGPITTWVNASISWSISSQGSSKWSSQALCPGDLLAPVMPFAACFPLPGGVLFLTPPEEVGGNEVKQ